MIFDNAKLLVWQVAAKTRTVHYDTQLLSAGRFIFTINYKNQFELTVKNANKKSEIDFNDFLILLTQTEFKHLENYSDSFVALYRIFRFCNILVERGAYLPRLMHHDQDIYQMLWIPALFNESVNIIFSKLTPWLPENIVNVKVKKQNKIKNSTNGFQSIRKEEALQLLCLNKSD